MVHYLFDIKNNTMYFFVIKCSKIVPRKNSLPELLFLSYLKSQACDIVYHPSEPVKFN